jgi:hypothetical protein
MQLPNRANAYISHMKLREYLLSGTPPVGRFKAKVFTSVGFTEHHIDRLREGLLAIAYTNEVRERIQGAYGEKYVLDGALPAPRGTLLQVRTVWFIDTGEVAPRFVAAYPL